MRINLSTPLSDDKEMQRRNKAVLDAIELHLHKRMAVDYVCELADDSRYGGQPVVDNAMLEALQKDAGIPHLPTQETYQFRMAVSDDTWIDEFISVYVAPKDVTHVADFLRSKYRTTQSDALQAENEQLRHDLERQMTIANEHVNEVERLREAVEKERAAIVAWLLECMELYISRGLDTYVAIEDIAHNIERGEHHGAPPE